ncbi:D-glucarate permease [Klebsiella pneumoniae]|uniref:D-glucarate permease n=1 Tax=Klebsiella pneumoniae TaxID=573 RepID=A0A2X3D3P7_KLEPN|nr:D-glucarate permease [Klebsiella pneumoniae]
MSSLSQAATALKSAPTARYWIVVMLFIVTSFNYGDRRRCRSPVRKWPGISALIRWGMGYVFSAFSWAYVIGQIPGGWPARPLRLEARLFLVDLHLGRCLPCCRASSISSAGFGIIVALFTLRFLVGLAESPSFPGNSRIVAAWFPRRRGGQRYRFLTPPSTLPPLFSRRSWAG